LLRPDVPVVGILLLATEADSISVTVADIFRRAHGVLPGKHHVPKILPNTARDIVTQFGPENPVSVVDKACFGDCVDPFPGDSELSAARLSEHLRDRIIREYLPPRPGQHYFLLLGSILLHGPRV